MSENIGVQALEDTRQYLQKFLDLMLMLTEYSWKFTEFIGHNVGDKIVTAAGKAVGVGAVKTKEAIEKAVFNKIRYGQISEKQLVNFYKEGGGMQVMGIPTEHIQELDSFLKKVGGSFIVLQNNGTNASIAVPNKSAEQVNQILAMMLQRRTEEGKLREETSAEVKEIMKNDPELFKDFLYAKGIEFVGLENDKLIINNDKEKLQEFFNAVTEFKERTEGLEGCGIGIVSKDTKGISVFEVTEDQANQIAEKYPDMQFTENKGILYALTTNSEQEKTVKEILEAPAKDAHIGISEENMAFADNVITLDKGLIKSVDETSKFMRIPNTAGTEYIRFQDDELTEKIKGKTYTKVVDRDKIYQIYNADGKPLKAVKGDELLKYYNTKEILSNKFNDKTQKMHPHGDSTITRIELFLEKENKYIGIGMPVSAVEIKDILENAGMSKEGIEQTLNRIYYNIPETYKAALEYSPVKEEKKYQTVDNIDIDRYIKESEVWKNVDGLKQLEQTSSDNQVLIYNDKSNTYSTIDIMSSDSEINKTLQNMGITDMGSLAILNRINTARKDIVTENINSKPLMDLPIDLDKNRDGVFDRWQFMEKDNSFILTNQNKDGFNEFAVIGKDTGRAEIEKCIRDKFGVAEEKVVSVMSALTAKELIVPPETHTINNIRVSDSEIGKKEYASQFEFISSTTVNLSIGYKDVFDGHHIERQINLKDLTADKILEQYSDLGLNKKSAEKIVGNIMSAKEKKRNRTPLSEIIAKGKETKDRINEGISEIKEKLPIGKNSR